MEAFRPVIDELCRIAEALKNEKLIILSEFLRQRIFNPDTYLAFLGESCSGKSTLINLLSDRPVLPVSGVPLTGTVTEIRFENDITEEPFCAINRDATLEVIDEETFKELAVKPDEALERLRYTSHTDSGMYKGVKIFDTPGYGSLIKEHTEVLTRFLPEADAVLYVVSYRSGFQEEDYSFLKSLLELSERKIPFFLVINRCPENAGEDDKRVNEISGYVSDLLQEKSVPVIMVRTFEDDGGDTRAEFKKSVEKIFEELNSEERRNELRAAFREYILELIELLKTENARLDEKRRLSEEDLALLRSESEELAGKIEKADKLIIKPGFKELYDGFPVKIEEGRSFIERETINVIDEQSKLKKTETVAYIGRYVLNRNAEKAVDELKFYQETKLSIIDKKLNDYLDTALIEFEKDLKLKNPGAVYDTGVNLAKKLSGRLLNAGLLSYFAGFGGAGGAAAGVANAASHMLKNVGQLFNRTFSLQTHNALKHTLSSMGLTSVKSIASFAAAAIEITAWIIDLNTWKLMLRDQVKKTAAEWAEDMKKTVLADVKKLEEKNLKTIKELAAGFREAYSEEDHGEYTAGQLEEYAVTLEELERRVNDDV